ncbi:RNase adapter RapZ [Eggerthellaceae bacterium zg-887]|uniref:RNase adapter RapZ n=1 Tax=Xiamenia xianingshaonis TaxID=2682776 RepID=UPI00140AD5B6|nr:RNase adapter RapZ [Xiamenia xianingshaonis]NHM16113.1 RNase adapter RapZ [Xiamenia xianingshaonis]
MTHHTQDQTAEGGLSPMPELVVLTGMSGAGRTEAMHVFEDLGYFCVDNLPVNLIDDLLALDGFPGQSEGQRRIAVVVDARNMGFFRDVGDEIAHFEEVGLTYRIIFLDASDEKLVARYKASRRRHPLCGDGASVIQGIERERDMLCQLRDNADHVIDTTDMLPQELRREVQGLFDDREGRRELSVTVYSFGFKHGAPVDADLVMDVRFLPNPYYDPKLRSYTGLDAPVRDYVLYRPETEEFLKRWRALLDCVMPGYVAEGKQQLAIGVGCTGGQHRSVALAEATGDYLKSRGYRVSTAHRDLKLAEGSDGRLVADDEAEREGAEGARGTGAPTKAEG